MDSVYNSEAATSKLKEISEPTESKKRPLESTSNGTDLDESSDSLKQEKRRKTNGDSNDISHSNGPDEQLKQPQNSSAKAAWGTSTDQGGTTPSTSFNQAQYQIQSSRSTVAGRGLPRYVYRVLRDDEDIDDGIYPKDEDAHYTPEEFICEGSRLETQFIATSASADKADIKFNQNMDKDMVKIDLQECLDANLTIHDFRQGQNLISEKAIKYARSAKEILIEGGEIPRSAYSLWYFE